MNQGEEGEGGRRREEGRKEGKRGKEERRISIQSEISIPNFWRFPSAGINLNKKMYYHSMKHNLFLFKIPRGVTPAPFVFSSRLLFLEKLEGQLHVGFGKSDFRIHVHKMSVHHVTEVHG